MSFTSIDIFDNGLFCHLVLTQTTESPFVAD